MNIHRGDSLVDEKKKPKRNKSQTLALKARLICGAGLALLLFAGYVLATQLLDYSKSTKLYEKTVNDYVSIRFDEETGEKAGEESSEYEGDWKNLVEVDLSKLREINEDIIGWIYFENVDINYPVLYSEDNANYLTKAYTGETFSAGSIFMGKENARDFSDVHTIIYGHNMRNLSMFGNLKNYVRDNEYINGHEYFQIITENGKFRYKIFSYKVVADDSDVYTIYRAGSQDFGMFIKNVIQKGNHLDNSDKVGFDDHLITLSTCLNDDRLVVTGVRCDEMHFE